MRLKLVFIYKKKAQKWMSSISSDLTAKNQCDYDVDKITSNDPNWSDWNETCEPHLSIPISDGVEDAPNKGFDFH